MGEQRSVRRDYDDDRPDVFVATARLIESNIVVFDLSPDWNTIDEKLVAAPEVRLHKPSNRVATGLFIELTRCSANTAFETVADHPGSAADVTFHHRARL